jgi:Fe-S-cluster containining protein
LYITQRDLERMAEYLKLTPGEFETRYVFRTRHLLRLRKPRNKQCHFLEDGGCSVHSVKPVQCRLYPFWPDLVEYRDVWDHEGKKCPGINQGPLVQIGRALEVASEMTAAYPSIYGASSRAASSTASE